MVTAYLARASACVRLLTRATVSCAIIVASLAGAASAQTAQPQRVAPVPQPPVARDGNGQIVDDGNRTRFIITLERAAEHQVFALSNPHRVIVDLPNMRMQLPQAPTGQSVGLVRGFRAGVSADARARVVIEVTAPVVIERHTIEKLERGGARLVLDIVSADAALKSGPQGKRPAGMAGLGASDVQPPMPKPASSPAALSRRTYKPVIVLDPGHGGHDSGAKKHGAVEKDVVLAFSKVLRDKLRATGRYTVLMTRDTDVFIPLDDRRSFAERNNAALFIAIHADYASATARGATIYSLNDSSARSLQRSAQGEVAKDVLSAKEVADVRKYERNADAVVDILKDLARREVSATQERTNFFTRSVIDTMGESTSLQNNPDRQAAFRVLQTQKIPSVLIELAYVSNKQDAQNLKSETWRDKVSTSIMAAIENYFSHQIARLQM